jgi:hypothetical protein
MIRQTWNCLIEDRKSYRERLLDGRPMACRLDRRILNTLSATSLLNSLTVHYHSYILDKAVDDLEGLCCGYPSLVHGESV